MQQSIYIGTYTQGSSEGIYEYSGGALKLAAPLVNPSYFIFNKNRTLAYAVSETQEFQGANGGAAASFTVASDGSLKQTAILPTFGKDPCHLCLSSDEKALFVANYTEGTLCRYTLNDSGALEEMPEIARHHGHGPNPDRQEGPHIHFVTLCPGHPQKLWTVDLGLDAIFVYGTGVGALSAPLFRFPVPSGYGPRHIAFHPVLPLAYVVQELANRILTISIDENGLPGQILDDISTLPPHWEGYSKAAAIRCSQDGAALYVSNRGHESIAAYRLTSDGIPHLTEFAPTGGISPRDIILTDHDRKILCAHQDGGGVTAISIDQEGHLSKPSTAIQADAPVCLQIF